jgi:hypothetical protein
MKNLLYISYGAGLHEQETIFSLLSAWRWAPPGTDDLRFLVYTDHPPAYADLPVAVEFIPTEQWVEWSGPTRFNHRRKILALQHAFQKYSAPTVLLDGDTWFRKPPQSLLDRIGTGRTIMHLNEGRLTGISSPIIRGMSALLQQNLFFGPGGRALSIAPDSSIWNAGVVGLDPSDSHLLDDVLLLTDQLCAKSNLHILEQFAFSHVLEQGTKLAEAGDIIFHYWPPYLHDPFRRKLPKVLAECSHLSLKRQAEFCYARRPRPSFPRRSKVLLKRILQALGFLRGRAKSNEW